MMLTRFMLALLFLLAATAPVQAAAIPHASASVTTNQTTSSTTMTTITGASIPSGSFTVGKQYLILVDAQIGYTAGDGTQVQLVHGSTPFAGTDQWISFAADTNRHIYRRARVWTAVSSEAIELQFKSRLGGANVASANFVHIFAMQLDDYLSASDWCYNEASADDAMSTAFEDGATCTFTPGTASHNWLVLGDAYVDYAAQSANYVTVRLTDGTNVLPQAQIDIPNTALDEIGIGLARVYTLAASSQTFKIQYKVSASTTANHLHSAIFALDLHKFRNHAFAYTEAGTNLSATDYATQIQTLSITPDVQGDVFVGSYWSFDRNSSGNTGEQRIQIDNSDSPAGQTTANYQFRHGTDGTDEDPMTISTLVANMTAAAHTIDLDGSVSATTSTPQAETATLFAFTMELPAAASSTGGLMLMGVGR